MSNRKIPRRLIQDPLGKKYWPILKGRDPGRTPMQWDASPHAGFSAVDPWLPVHPNHGTVNVENQTADPGSLLSFYRELIWLRKRTPALCLGDYRSLDSGSKEAHAFVRSHGEEAALVLLNFVDRSTRVAVRGGAEETVGGAWEVLFGTDRAVGSRMDISTTIELNGYEVLILGKKGDS
jgi:alpha-glucosidase